MPKTRAQKEQIVKGLTDKLDRAKSVVFVDYKGLTMSQLSDLRSKLREVGAEFTITKNSLLKLASTPYKLPPTNYQGPIATLFSYEDEITPIKILTKAIKDAQIGSVKLGIFNGELIDNVIVQKLASLPSKEELRANIVGSLGAPLYGIVGVLQANLRNLVYALDQIRVMRGGV
ncbi:50S ribosomal protein L10 [Candidatus Daviesbacteria bacterium]|nr:50S ribosomal protein L10 [Candidatus Daviesbacteria bacterium]